MEQYVERVRRSYLDHGFGGRVGFGERPALAVIDLAGGWTEAESQHGADLSSALTGTVALLNAARLRAIPIYFTTMAFDPSRKDRRGNVLRKLPHQSGLLRGTSLVRLHESLERRSTEPLINKSRASAFFGTPLLSYLIDHAIDTLLLAGCSTSGCIRATAESAHNYGLRAVVVREAVGDRSPEAHEYNLMEIDARYADVVSLDAVREYIELLDQYQHGA